MWKFSHPQKPSNHHYHDKELPQWRKRRTRLESLGTFNVTTQVAWHVSKCFLSHDECAHHPFKWLRRKAQSFLAEYFSCPFRISLWPHSHQAIVCLFEQDLKSVNQDVAVPINTEASPHLSPLACLVFSAGCGQRCQEFPLQTQLQSIFRCILKSWRMARAVCAPSAYLGACSCARRPNCTIDWNK